MGIGATVFAASAFWISRLPTWGPLPCVSTTRQPSSTKAAMRRMAPSMLNSCSSKVPTWPGWRMALPPRAITTEPPDWVSADVILSSPAERAASMPSATVATTASSWASSMTSGGWMRSTLPKLPPTPMSTPWSRQYWRTKPAAAVP